MMMQPAFTFETLEDVYTRLMAARLGDPLEETLARIVASWYLGKGAMPQWLGLGEASFHAMMKHHFPVLHTNSLVSPRDAIDVGRAAELEDLRELLVTNRSGRSESEIWMAEIVIAGCMGSDHLWQDLGLWQRADLSKLMLDNFAPLALRNVKDMKWKKFLYKQLCEAEGIYVCRSPSCEVCVDYDNCFGSEE
jgi:nitrogen fixation protein NifQ